MLMVASNPQLTPEVITIAGDEVAIRDVRVEPLVLVHVAPVAAQAVKVKFVPPVAPAVYVHAIVPLVFAFKARFDGLGPGLALPAGLTVGGLGTVVIPLRLDELRLVIVAVKVNVQLGPTEYDEGAHAIDSAFNIHGAVATDPLTFVVFPPAAGVNVERISRRMWLMSVLAKVKLKTMGKSCVLLPAVVGMPLATLEAVKVIAVAVNAIAHPAGGVAEAKTSPLLIR